MPRATHESAMVERAAPVRSTRSKPSGPTSRRHTGTVTGLLARAVELRSVFGNRALGTMIARASGCSCDIRRGCSCAEPSEAAPAQPAAAPPAAGALLQRLVCVQTNHPTNAQHTAIQQYYNAQICNQSESEYGVPAPGWNGNINAGAQGYVDIADGDHDEIYEIKPQGAAGGADQVAGYQQRVLQCGGWVNADLGTQFPAARQVVNYGPGLRLEAWRSAPGLIRYGEISDSKKRKLAKVEDAWKGNKDEIVKALLKIIRRTDTASAKEVEASLTIMIEGGGTLKTPIAGTIAEAIRILAAQAEAGDLTLPSLDWSELHTIAAHAVAPAA
jgi:hypothetical protein